jgi:hypothetical protein
LRLSAIFAPFRHEGHLAKSEKPMLSAVLARKVSISICVDYGHPPQSDLGHRPPCHRRAATRSFEDCRAPDLAVHRPRSSGMGVVDPSLAASAVDGGGVRFAKRSRLAHRDAEDRRAPRRCFAEAENGAGPITSERFARRGASHWRIARRLEPPPRDQGWWRLRPPAVQH